MDRDDIAVTLGAVALVPTVFGAMCPALHEVRAGVDEHGHVGHSIACATMTAAGLLLAVAVAARSWPVLIYGGAALTAYAFTYGVAREYR